MIRRKRSSSWADQGPFWISEGRSLVCGCGVIDVVLNGVRRVDVGRVGRWYGIGRDKRGNEREKGKSGMKWRHYDHIEGVVREIDGGGVLRKR